MAASAGIYSAQVMNALNRAATGKWVAMELDPNKHDYGGYIVALCEKPKAEVADPILEADCRSDELEFETGSCEPDCEGAAAASPDFDENSSSTDGAVTFFSIIIVLLMILSGV